MKKGISILLVVLMLAAMLHFTVSKHYCGGNVAALKISVTGKLASCGMEECKEAIYPPAETRLFTHCCDDVVAFYAIENNYTPSFPVIPDFYQYNLNVYNIPAGLPVHSPEGIKYYTNVSPPGTLMSTSVDLSDICIFRI